MNKAPRGKGFEDPGDEVPQQPPRYTDHHHNSIAEHGLGAFVVKGMSGASSVAVSVLSLPSTTDNSTVSPDATHLSVDEERPSSPIRVGKATSSPWEVSKPTETQHLNVLLKSRKCRTILALTLALIVGVIVVVLFTKNGSKAATPSPTQAPIPVTKETAIKKFLAELKPLLSSESLTALDDPDSPQNQSLKWLLETSSFQSRTVQRQVQRYAMATIYFATGGASWSHDGGNWLTDETECTWPQGSEGEFCDENGTLLILKQRNNMLNGTIPDEIGLLSSLKDIDLSENQNLFGTVPSEIGSLIALRSLDLHNNSFTGSAPSELGSLAALKLLNLDTNHFTGAVPSEIGSLTELTDLLLGTNSFNGTVPTELGSLIALSYLILGSNPFSGTLPSELGSLTTLTGLLLGWTDSTGTIPSELHNLTNLETLVLTGTNVADTGVLQELCDLGTTVDFVSGLNCTCCTS